MRFPGSKHIVLVLHGAHSHEKRLVNQSQTKLSPHVSYESVRRRLSMTQPATEDICTSVRSTSLKISCKTKCRMRTLQSYQFVAWDRQIFFFQTSAQKEKQISKKNRLEKFFYNTRQKSTIDDNLTLCTRIYIQEEFIDQLGIFLFSYSIEMKTFLLGIYYKLTCRFSKKNIREIYKFYLILFL